MVYRSAFGTVCSSDGVQILAARAKGYELRCVFGSTCAHNEDWGEGVLNTLKKNQTVKGMEVVPLVTPWAEVRVRVFPELLNL